MTGFSPPLHAIHLERGFEHERVGTWSEMNGFNRTLTLVGRWSRRLGLDRGSAKVQWIYFSSLTSALHAAAFSGNLGGGGGATRARGRRVLHAALLFAMPAAHTRRAQRP